MPLIAIPAPHSADSAYNDRSLPQYIHALEEAGLAVEPISPLAAPEEIARLATRCDGVLLPGSLADVDPQKYGERREPECHDSDPRREMADELLLQDAYNMHKPVLGICYGLQSLNVWRSGALVQNLPAVPVNHEAGRTIQIAHQVEIETDSTLGRTLADHPLGRAEGKFLLPVNSSHHQAVQTAGDGLRVVARCSADGVIEALEGTSPDHWVAAVQWHPERDRNSGSAALFAAFARAAETWRSRGGPY